LKDGAFLSSLKSSCNVYHDYYPQIIVMSSHFDKCIVTLGHFSTTNISTGDNWGQGQGHRGALSPPLAPPMPLRYFD